MKNHKILFYSVAIVIAIIAVIALANSFIGAGNYVSAWFYVLYNLGYGILLSTLIPLWLIYKEKEGLQSLGFKKIGIRQIIVILGFVIFSIGGQMIPLDISSINFEVLSLGFVPLVMTTFFEEFLFRGYMQTRFEKQYGWIFAVLLSGFLFSIYHLGYPGFRTIVDTLILFAVGIGFALAFKLSGGNVIVSYFVNLPNAFLTYILKFEQFPAFDNNTPIIAGITIAFIILILAHYAKNVMKRTVT